MQFRDLPTKLAANNKYPITESALVEQYGHVTMRTVDGNQPISTLLDAEADTVFDDTSDLLQHLHAAHTPSLRLADVPPYIAALVEFPITQNRLLSLFGAIAIEATGEETGETVREAIERCNDDPTYEYTDVNDLSDTIFCNVGDEYIGRKYYDDRGSNVGSEEDMVSF